MNDISQLILQALVKIKNACIEKKVKHGIIDNISGTIFLVQKILKYNDPKTIGFFGAQKRGKSSLINQLLGCDLMPVSPIPMSSVVIEIQQDNALSSDEFTIDVIGTNGSFDTSVVDLDSAQTLLQEYGSHKGKLSDEVDTIRVISRFQQSKILENGGVLVDTPGAEVAFEVNDDNNDEDAKRAIKILASMHIVIFVERADLMQSENSRQFFTNNLKPMRPLSVINWKDAFDLDSKYNTITDSDIRERQKQIRMREIMLKTYGVNLDRVMCVSSKEAAIAQKDINNINQDMLERSNLPNLEKRILGELSNLSPKNGLVTSLCELQKTLYQLDFETAKEVFTGAKRPFFVIFQNIGCENQKLTQIAKNLYEQYN